MDSEPKKKHKATTFKSFLKTEDRIKQIDIKSYWVKSFSEEGREPYLVYNSDSKGWLCDCIWWSIHMADCKHISQVRKQFNV